MVAVRIVVVGGALLASNPALAQAPSTKAPAPAPSTSTATPSAKGAATSDNAVSGVTVVGGEQAVQTSIDRRSYDVTRDLQATSGSIADALRSVPFVDVGAQGDVTMRGAGVTIMIDGKIAGAFRGANAGQALQALPASQIARVEVITNPSAEFTPEGAGGIINLITRKTTQAGLSGTVRANLADGHQNGGANLDYRAGKLSLNAGFSVRHEQQLIGSTSKENFFTSLGAPQSATSDQGFNSSHSDSLSYNLNGDYDLDAKTRVSAGYYHGSFSGGGQSSSAHTDFAADGTIAQQSDRRFSQTYGLAYDDVDFTLRRQLPGKEGHQLTLSLDYDIFASPNRRTVDEVVSPAASPLFFSDTPTRSRQVLSQLDLKYDRPMEGQSMLKLGYSLRQSDTKYHADGITGLSAALAAPDLGQTDAFSFKETVHALYATYERPIGKLTVLPGLRLEVASHDLFDTTSRQRVSADYLDLYPSLHLAYTLNDFDTLSFSYSHRISRPTAQDLNPFRQIIDPTHLREGNPQLHPQDTDSFEGSWQRRKDGTLLLATLFRRDTTGALADTVNELADDVLLTTRANIGESHATGLEISRSGKLFKTLSYNLSANASYVELFTPGVGLGSSGRRDGAVAGGKANVTWQATVKDLFQADASLTAKQLSPQGYTAPVTQLNLGYRHKIDDTWAINVTASDAANTVRFRTVVDTPQLQRRATADYNNRAIYLGFTYTFGQGPPRSPAFDFGGGGTAPTP